ncbi:hypothetical protein [Streptomyces sp. NBC_00474]|uniref:hypothetical protein n=1 Tax=Streptomyces sp. NBC_00474 TaxID=2975754 RepID=UPI00225BD89D|nr:hypothetical protein [Streptomyces sp. NBC_00474]MCX5050464.1 hypothetical protein [Streptomyces sp. NBC_00474]
MDRYVHHELRSVYSALVALAVCVPVTTGVRGAPLTAGGLGMFVTCGLAFTVVSTLLHASRVKWFGEVRDFERAVPLDQAPPAVSLRTHPLNTWLLAAMLVPTLALAIAWEPWVALLPLWAALPWLGQAWLAADWERRNGKALWRGHDHDAPWKLSVTPRPLPRTATGALPE